jgi:hypothetical protein
VAEAKLVAHRETRRIDARRRIAGPEEDFPDRVFRWDGVICIDPASRVTSEFLP